MGRSKPTTSKSASSKLGLSAEQAASLKQALNNGGNLSQQQLLAILHANESCEKSCKGKKDNPNCLCGLLPAPGAFRRKGLWQKEPQGLQQIGADPADVKKQDCATPSGLYNLGNTCYVNSALQCLFMIPAFRSAMYQVALPAADDVIISHIRRLFTDLQCGPRFSADPRSFAQALNLDHTVQQDGQEFLKLLLSLLEGKLGASGQATSASLVPDLFRGSYVYQTVCQACGQPSQGSYRATHFYELDIQVRGSSSLQNSLADMLSPEFLCGDNQFFCDFCNKKTDATRQLCLQQLPPYLCLSLQRFVFDMKKLMKVKASDKFMFPLSADFGPYQSSSSETAAGSQVYDLHAILIHKGSSASQGHYVAHVLEESSGKWWRFDDETVTAMPDGPIGAKADHGVSAAPGTATKKAGDAAKTKGKGRGRKRKKSGPYEAEMDDDESTPEPMQTAEDAMPSVSKADGFMSPPAQPQSPNDIVSSSAYMLLYKKKGWQGLAGQQQAADTSLPASLQEYVNKQHEEYQEACATYEATQRGVRKAIEERQAVVRAILDLAPVDSSESDCRLISAEWLSKWVDSDPELSEIDNSGLTCPHGQLSPNKPSDMKRVSVAAWHELQQRCGGGPELMLTDLCPMCLMGMLDTVTDADQQGHARENALAMAEDLGDQEAAPGSSVHAYFVSKTWLAGWRKRQGRTQSSVSPTEGIGCPHGQLLPATVGPKAKRTAVPPPLWNYFKERWQAAQQQQQQQRQQQQQASAVDDTVRNDTMVLDGVQEPEPSTSGPPSSTAGSSDAEQDRGPASTMSEFPVQSSQECQTCLAELDANNLNGQVMASMAEQDRQLAPHLAAGTAVYLEQGVKCTLMPRSWLQAWRSYVNTSRKGRAPATALPEQPPSLQDACQGLMCNCHSGAEAKLAHPLPGLTHRRGKWMQNDADKGIYEIISTADWWQLVTRFSPEHFSIRHIEVWLNIMDLVMDGNTVRVEGSRPDEDVLGDNPLIPMQQAHAPSTQQAANLDSMPPVCQDTIEQQEAAVMASRLDYTDAEVMVEVVAAADFKPNMLNLTGDRKSKRARKGRAPVKVSALETIHDLKLKIVQTLSIHPQNAALHVFQAGSWQLVTDEAATLAETSILPDQELIVVNTHEHDDDDLGSFFGPSSAARSQPESGFHGTALTDYSANLQAQDAVGL